MKTFTSMKQLKTKALINPETKAYYDILENEFANINQEVKKSLKLLTPKPSKDL